MSTARVKLPEKIEGLLRSELERVIHEANLGNDDTHIARRYLIDRLPQVDIAEEVGYERSTVSRRMAWILEKVERTADRMGYF